jgi:hypothetical protein
MMKRFSSTLAAVACSSFLVSGVALADNNANKSGSFGISGGSMAGVGGAGALPTLGFRYAISSGMLASLNLGFGTSSTTQDVDGTVGGEKASAFGIGADFDFKVVKGSAACTYVTAGLDYVSQSAIVTVDGEDTGTAFSDLGFGVGLKGEWFPVKKLSFATGVGISMSPNGKGQQVGSPIGGDEDEGGEEDDSVSYGGMDMGINADVLGNASVTYWF